MQRFRLGTHPASLGGRTRQQGETPTMGIRDTSGQDRPVAASSAASRQRRQWLAYAGGGAVVLMLAGWLLSGWAAGSRSVDASRLRIAEVRRGDLVRDISAEGRVIAANSPTLYAVAGAAASPRAA